MNKILSKVAALAASGAVVAGAAVAVPAAAAAGTHRTVIHNCAGRAQVAPHTYTLFCGDGNDELAKLRWKHWGAPATVATGNDRVDDCKPSCVAGKEKSYPVAVRLSERGAGTYRRLTLTFTAKVPAGMHRTETFKLSARGPVLS